MKTEHSIGGAWALASLLLCGSSLHAAQPALPFSLEQLRIGLPEEGAPRAVVGAYAVTAETIQGQPGLRVYRPRDLASFPSRDTLPVVVWGNGACMADGSNFAGYLSTIASYGFLVVTSAAVPNEPQARITSEHLIKALDWAQTEASRAGSALAGKIRIDSVAVMGMSCGGNIALEAARDPRVRTLGMWNSGVWNSGEMRAADGTLLVATTKADLEHVHVPTLYIRTPPMTSSVSMAYRSSSAPAMAPAIRAPTRTPMAESSPMSPWRGCAGSSRRTRRPPRCSRGRTARSARIRTGR